MENPIHRLTGFFRQLGLPDEPTAMEAFIPCHRPLPHGISFADAPFWPPSQAQFLREKINEDANWAKLVDTFAGLLT